jgi:outer membrane protein assembly factor BamB
MVALDKRTGTTAWASPPLAEERGCYCSPILLSVGDQLLLVNCGSKRVFAVDAETGKLAWQIMQVDPKNTVSSTPVLAGNRLIVGNSSRGFGAVFGIKFDELSAHKVWWTELSVSHRGLLGIGNRAFGASSRGAGRGWVGVDATKGGATQLADAPGGSLIYADKRFYCLSERGTMTLYKLTDEGFEATGSFLFADQKDVWAHPVICHGRLFLRCHDTLSCYDVRS